MGWKHYQTVDHSNESPRLVGNCLVSVYYNSSLQISIFQIHEIFNISYFPQFNLSFGKKISLSQNPPKSPKNLHKTTKQRLMRWAERFSVAWNVTKRLVDRRCQATSKQPSRVPRLKQEWLKETKVFRHFENKLLFGFCTPQFETAVSRPTCIVETRHSPEVSTEYRFPFDWSCC